jgi:zinc protease
MKFDRTQPPAPGAIRRYSFPPVDRRQLDNGVTSLVCRAGDLPLVTAHVVIDAGVAREGDGQHGLSQLTLNSLDGGTATHDGTELAWALEELGLELSAWTTWDAAHVRVTATTRRIEPALRLLADIIQTPAFPGKEVERARNEQLAEILQREAEPRALADDRAAEVIFQGSTYARTACGDPGVVAGLTHEHVRVFHADRFAPDGVTVLLVGDISPDAGHALTTAAFGDWDGRVADAPAFAPAADRAGRTIHVVDRPGSVQSELRLGHVGVARRNPAYFTVNVLNSLLGGSFMSRLNLSLREKHGFTYGVRSGFGFRRERGPFVIQTAVATDVTARALEESFREIDALLADGPTEEEVANARDYIAGVFPLQLQSTEDIAGRVAEIAVYDLPLDYFEHYRDRILAVSRDDVARAAKEFIHPDRMAILVVGDAAALTAGIEALGLGAVNVETQDAQGAGHE